MVTREQFEEFKNRSIERATIVNTALKELKDYVLTWDGKKYNARFLNAIDEKRAKGQYQHLYSKYDTSAGIGDFCRVDVCAKYGSDTWLSLYDSENACLPKIGCHLVLNEEGRIDAKSTVPALIESYVLIVKQLRRIEYIADNYDLLYEQYTIMDKTAKMFAGLHISSFMSFRELFGIETNVSFV